MPHCECTQFLYMDLASSVPDSRHPTYHSSMVKPAHPDNEILIIIRFTKEKQNMLPRQLNMCVCYSLVFNLFISNNFFETCFNVELSYASLSYLTTNVHQILFVDCNVSRCKFGCSVIGTSLNL